MRRSIVVSACLYFCGLGAQSLGPEEQTLTVPAAALTAIAASLKPLLSQNATIVLPNDKTWNLLQTRGTSPRIQPNFNAVVEPATEDDVQKTVQFAAKYSLPFLAVSGTHGWTKTLNNLPYGIQINLRKLNSTILDPEDNTATVGGGTLQWEANKALYARNKQTVTPICECVSIVGPLLSGGHGLLQNRHGFALDNLVSARVVLGNGTAVTASATDNPDLFWALRGAGQNFGIVTSVRLKVYDIPSNWVVNTFIYNNQKLESVLNLVNTLDGNATRPANLAISGVGTRIPPMDPKNPVISYTVSYQGPEAEAEPYFAQFRALGPMVVKPASNVSNIALYKLNQNDVNSPSCAPNLNRLGSGASLPSWNTTAARAAFDIFARMTSDPRFSHSVFLLESYGTQGAKAVDPSSTSLSLEERQYPVVANPSISWNGTAALGQADAEAYGEQIRQALFAGLPNGAKRHTYVNYAVGTENLNQMYGYDVAKLERLKLLKRQYDPFNRFGFYNPIPRF